MRLRHLVLFHLLDGVSPTDERVLAACAAEEQLTTSVPGDHGWVFGPDLSRREVSADFAGTGDFASSDALEDFLAHPLHVEAGRRWAGLVQLTVADIEVGP